MRPRTKEETAAYLAGYEAGRSVKRAPQWQPIEGAPNDDTRILAVSNRHEYDPEIIQSAAVHESTYFTHWMPLPPPPGAA